MIFIVIFAFGLSVLHIVLGMLNIFLGLAASAEANLWAAITMSPIWSGIFYIITGCLGIVCAKKRTSYMIMCFTACSIVSMVMAVVSIQLQRSGLNSERIRSEKGAQGLIIGTISLSAIEITVCIISAFVSCRLAKAVKKNMEREREHALDYQDGLSDTDNNNKCVVYTVDKGYHNFILATVSSKAVCESEKELDRQEGEFTDLAAITDVQADNEESLQEVDHPKWPVERSQVEEVDFSDSCASSILITRETPFQSYVMRETKDNDNSVSFPPTQTKFNRSSDTKTVTFSTEGDQILQLSPAVSVTSSPLIFPSSKTREKQRQMSGDSLE